MSAERGPGGEGRSPAFYADFRDSVVAFSYSHGRTHTTNDDLLVVAATYPATSRIFREQGIATGGLTRDLSYTMHFGRPEGLVVHGGTSGSLYKEAVHELLSDLEAFRERDDYLQEPEASYVAGRFLGVIREHLDSRGRVFSDPRSIEKSDIKATLLAATLEGFMKDLVENPIGRMGRDISPRDINGILDGHSGLVSPFIRFAEDRFRIAITDEEPLKVLEAVNRKSGPFDAVSPFQIVSFITSNADPFAKYLLHRNGMLTPEEYVPPGSMPNEVVVKHALGALNFVEQTRGTTVGVVNWRSLLSLQKS